MKKSAKYLYVALLLFCMASIGGCALGVLFVPDPRQLVKAEYRIPKDKKVAILIDDNLAPLPNAKMKNKLAEKIFNILIANKAIKDYQVIKYEKVRRIANRVVDNKKISIKKVGELVKADYVIYINIIEFNLQSDADNPLIKPIARAYVKVIEVETGNRVWPVSFLGKEVIATQRMAAELANSSHNSEYTNKLLNALAEQIANLFFDHREG